LEAGTNTVINGNSQGTAATLRHGRNFFTVT